jgi:hypothetical protein
VLALLRLYYLNKNTRTKLGVKKKTEYVVIALVAMAVVSSVIVLLAS